jgi:outer membrane murein-binding lipoprotein Lpp
MDTIEYINKLESQVSGLGDFVQEKNETIAQLRQQLDAAQAENARLVAGIQAEIENQKRSIEANGRYNEAFYIGRVDSANHTLARLEKLLQPNPPAPVSEVKPVLERLRDKVESMADEVYGKRSEAQESVTLADDEIDWLAKRQQFGNLYEFWDTAKFYRGFQGRFLIGAELDEYPKGYGYTSFYKLRPEFDTAANRAAIESRRKELDLIS